MEARENTTGISQIDQEAANAVLRAGLLAEVDQEAGNSFLAGSMLTTYSRFGRMSDRRAEMFVFLKPHSH